MQNLPFFTAIAAGAIVLTTAFVGGLKNWKETAGKVVTVIAGTLLALLMAFVALVAIIVVSGKAGHPF